MNNFWGPLTKEDVLASMNAAGDDLRLSWIPTGHSQRGMLAGL